MNRIKEVIKGRGVKQTWLAVRLGKSYNMVNGYVQNRRQLSLEDLFRIADILDVNTTELLKNKNDRRTTQSIRRQIMESSRRVKSK
ncbi:helix-turn-helix domain-containing protein [Flavobacteriaceae bacterium]|nr:helix-turn-helix domain-containing protein [Flavobacteriaceae bacterium]